MNLLFRHSNIRNLKRFFFSSQQYIRRELWSFTLVEIIVVIIIVSILAGILTPLATVSIRRAKIKETEDKMGNLNSALLLYYKDKALFPSALTDLEPDYIRSSEYTQDYAQDAWRKNFVYTYNSGALSVTLRSFGPDRTDNSGGGDDITYVVSAKTIWKKWRKICQDRLKKVNEAVESYKRDGGTITTGDDSTKLANYLDASNIYDVWGRPFHYDPNLSTFYSYGCDGSAASGDEIYPQGVNTTP